MKKYGIVMEGMLNIDEESTLPTFNTSRDIGRLIKTTTPDGIYAGVYTGWKRIDTARNHDISGSEPDNPQAGQMYYDTDNSCWYLRNSENTTWIPMFTTTTDRIPIDSRDGGATFDSATLATYPITSFGVSITSSGNEIYLLNSNAEVISWVTIPYSLNANNTNALDGYSYSSFAPVWVHQLSYYWNGTVYSRYYGPNGYAYIDAYFGS